MEVRLWLVLIKLRSLWCFVVINEECESESFRVINTW